MSFLYPFKNKPVDISRDPVLDAFKNAQTQAQSSGVGGLSSAYLTGAHKDTDYDQWTVKIAKVEDGYFIEVNSTTSSFTKKYVATDVNALTDQIKRALVESKLLSGPKK